MLVGSFAVCQGVNAAYTLYSTVSSFSTPSKDTEMAREQLDRVNKRIKEINEKNKNQCSSQSDKDKLMKLEELKNKIMREILKKMENNTREIVMMSLENIGTGMIGVGACGAALLIPFF